MLQLKDFVISNNGNTKKRLGYAHNQSGGYVTTGFKPMLTSNHFEFGYKIHRETNSMFIGISSGKHSKKNGVGQYDAEGWGLIDDGRCFHNIVQNGGGQPHHEGDVTFKVGDVIGFEVKKKEGVIFAFKNGKRLGVLFESMTFPRELQIVFSCYRDGSELELVHFKDLACSEETTEEEEGTSAEIRKMKEEMKFMWSTIRTLQNNVAELTKENKAIKERMKYLQ